MHYSIVDLLYWWLYVVWLRSVFINGNSKLNLAVKKTNLPLHKLWSFFLNAWLWFFFFAVCFVYTVGGENCWYFLLSVSVGTLQIKRKDPGFIEAGQKKTRDTPVASLCSAYTVWSKVFQQYGSSWAYSQTRQCCCRPTVSKHLRD